MTKKLSARIAYDFDEDDMIMFGDDKMSWRMFTKSMLKSGWKLHIDDGRIIAEKEFDMDDYKDYLIGVDYAVEMKDSDGE